MIAFRIMEIHLDQQQASPNDGCPTCGGSGWRILTSPDGVQRATQCECRFGSWSGRLLKQARIPARYEHCTLESFDPAANGPNPSLERAVFEAGHFVQEYHLLETRGLLIIGPIGVGKTHLAIGIMRELLKKNIPCLFYDYRELLKEIQNSYNDSVHVTELDILKPVFESEVLILDELGVVRPTDWVWDTVNYILNTRYNQRKTTIITTNLQDLPPGASRSGDYEQQPKSRQNAEDANREATLGDRIGERMRSRLQEMCMKIYMDGSDFRIRTSRTMKVSGANVQFRLSRKKNHTSS